MNLSPHRLLHSSALASTVPVTVPAALRKTALAAKDPIRLRPPPQPSELFAASAIAMVCTLNIAIENIDTAGLCDPNRVCAGTIGALDCTAVLAGEIRIA